MFRKCVSIIVSMIIVYILAETFTVQIRCNDTHTNTHIYTTRTSTRRQKFELSIAIESQEGEISIVRSRSVDSERPWALHRRLCILDARDDRSRIEPVSTAVEKSILRSLRSNKVSLRSRGAPWFSMVGSIDRRSKIGRGRRSNGRETRRRGLTKLVALLTRYSRGSAMCIIIIVIVAVIYGAAFISDLESVIFF